MSYDIFLDWLMDEKKLSQRTAKGVISRCKCICKILSINKFEITTIENLNINKEFSEKSMFIKSQLRRACTLLVEFGGIYEKI